MGEERRRGDACDADVWTRYHTKMGVNAIPERTWSLSG